MSGPAYLILLRMNFTTLTKSTFILLPIYTFYSVITLSWTAFENWKKKNFVNCEREILNYVSAFIFVVNITLCLFQCFTLKRWKYSIIISIFLILWSSVITNSLWCPIGHFRTKINPVITNSNYNEQKWPVPCYSL